MASHSPSRWMAGLHGRRRCRSIRLRKHRLFRQLSPWRPDGIIAVGYYDLRNDGADTSTLLANYWLVQSRDGGNTWSETAIWGPFNYRNAPLATLGNALFPGDYAGMVGSGKSFLTLFPVTNPIDGPNTSRL